MIIYRIVHPILSPERIFDHFAVHRIESSSTRISICEVSIGQTSRLQNQPYLCIPGASHNRFFVAKHTTIAYDYWSDW